jgi:dihydroorotate dehydrogenase (NAD+) catalytic subunit
VGTAVFGDPSAPMRIQNEVAQILESKGFNNIAEVSGIAHQVEAQ